MIIRNKFAKALANSFVTGRTPEQLQAELKKQEAKVAKKNRPQAGIIDEKGKLIEKATEVKPSRKTNVNKKVEEIKNRKREKPVAKGLDEGELRKHAKFDKKTGRYTFEGNHNNFLKSLLASSEDVLTKRQVTSENNQNDIEKAFNSGKYTLEIGKQVLEFDIKAK